MRFRQYLWHNRAHLHFAGPNYMPDFAAAYALRKKLKGGQDWRRAYYLKTILQGAAEDFVSKQVEADAGGAIKFKHCQQPVTGSVLGRLAYSCNKLSEVRLQGIEDSQHLVDQAAAELPLYPAKWLRGLLPLNTPDAFSMKYDFNSSFRALMFMA